MRWLNTRTLVTGAGGFIGRALSRAALNAGAQVYGSQRSRPVPQGVLPCPIPHDDGQALAELIAELQPQVVFHLGSPVDPDRDPERFPEMISGVLSTSDRVARACLVHGIRLVHVGTCEEYGDNQAPFHEDMPLSPVSPYSAAKAAASHWVSCLTRTQGLRATIARPFLTYGPGQAPARLVPAAIQAALSGQPFPMTRGLQTRELNYVDDIAQGLLLCAQERAVGATLNLCGGPELPVIDIVRQIFALAQADPALVQAGALPERAGEVMRFCGDPSAARARIGYASMTSLRAGLLACIQDAQ